MTTRIICILLLLLAPATALYPQTTARERIEQRRQQNHSASTLSTVTDNQPNAHWEEKIAQARWSRIIYRYIDLTKEANAPLYHPTTPTAGQQNLFTLIFRLLQENRIRAYEYLDGREEFTEAYLVSFPELLTRFGITHETGNGTISVSDADMPSNEVTGYYLKEAYFFDSATSGFRVRPLALCPMLVRQEEYASADTRYPLFWVAYQELEPYTRRMPLMASTLNNSMDESMDDFFRKRSYQGEIYKTGSPGNRSIAQYTSTPEEMKAEQEQIEKELVDFQRTLEQGVSGMTNPRPQTQKSSGSRSKKRTQQTQGATQTMRDRRY